MYERKPLLVGSLIAVLLIASCWSVSGEERPLEIRVIQTDKPARLVQLTAHLTVTNSSDVDISRYIFRVTVPPDLDSQRCIVKSRDASKWTRKDHKNGANEYLELEFPVDGNQSTVKDVTFLVVLMPVDYSKVKKIDGRDQSASNELDQFVKPSKHIESDSLEVQQAASVVFKRTRTDLAKARAAYEFPSKVLKFQLQTKPLGAQKALQGRTGDCTEYACLFSALCRTQSLPARRVGVFNFGPKTQIAVEQPNHHIAEVHLASHGWIPVDANLGRGAYNRPIGFGKLQNTIVLLNREGAWVWSTWLPPNGYNKSLGKPSVSYGISWEGEVVKEGSVRDLYREWYAQKQKNK